MFQVMTLIYFAIMMAIFFILIFMEVNEINKFSLVPGHKTKHNFMPKIMAPFAGRKNHSNMTELRNRRRVCVCVCVRVCVCVCV